MVSLRRRKLLGLYAGRSSVLTPFLHSVKSTISSAGPAQNVKSIALHPLPLNDRNEPMEKLIIKAGYVSLNVSTSSSSKEQQSQLYPEQPIKRRKRHRRKQLHNQEPCLMRGVYFKNMKWQAAIKVDKKQIHLGTVGTQEEAGRLYDRAAFMCGRQPNFELSEEEKLQLRKFNWEEFLAITRRAINSKKSKRSGLEMRKTSEPNLDSKEWSVKLEINSFSASEEAEPDSSAS